MEANAPEPTTDTPRPEVPHTEPTEPETIDNGGPSNQFEAKVVGNSDGDSCTVLTDDKTQVVIRLHGIDCPERGQPYGDNAKKALSPIVGKRVLVVDKGDAGWNRRAADLYVINEGEPTGVVETINLQLVRQGWAWRSTKFSQDERWR